MCIRDRDDSGNGYAFKVKDKGFGGVYNVMVGIGNDGNITGVKLLDNTETPGLGSKTQQNPCPQSKDCRLGSVREKNKYILR